jgi:glucokinase
MIAADEAVLLGDVGATNARFAVLFDRCLDQSNGSRLPITRRSTAR